MLVIAVSEWDMPGIEPGLQGWYTSALPNELQYADFVVGLVMFISVCFLQLIVILSEIYLFKLNRCFNNFPQTIDRFLFIQSGEQSTQN